MKPKFVATILSALIVTTACEPASKTDSASTLKIGNGAEPQSLDPAKNAGSWDARIVLAMFQGLMRRNAMGEPIAGMATSWTTSEDGLTWTFIVRDATWSDGVPVTAEDFVAAFVRLFTIAPPPSTVDIYYPIVNAKEVREGKAPKESLGVRALNARTIEFKLNHPTPYFLELMAGFTVVALPRHVVAKHGEDWIKAENIVVNGAFKLAQWKPGDFVHLVRNPSYWNNASVCLDNLYLFPTGDLVAAERQMRAGALDIQIGFSGSRLAEINKTMPGMAQVAPVIRSDFLIFNHRKLPFTDVRLRRALSLAIDREFVAGQVLNDGSTPAFGLVPPTTPNYPATANLRWKNEPRAKRLEEARALLEAAGYGPSKPFVFRMLHSSGGEGPRFAPVLQQNWRDIAPWVEPTLEGAETAVHIRNLRAGDFDVGWASWGSAYADASEHLGLLETGASSNRGAYSNPAFDAILARTRQTVDPAERTALLPEAEQILLDDNAIAPLFFMPASNLVNPRVTGWQNNPRNVHPFEFMCTKEATR
jgi:oligopeptide transport system substrate-binding protein